MANVSSNGDAVRRNLFSLSQALNPKRRLSDGKRFGDHLVTAAAAAIRERTAGRQETPSGEPLAPLNEKYKRRKARQGLDERILVAHDAMLHASELEGVVTVTDSVVVMEAGTTEEVKKKVEWAHHGSDVRPERPFYELGADGEAAVDGLVRNVLADAVKGGTA